MDFYGMGVGCFGEFVFGVASGGSCGTSPVSDAFGQLLSDPVVVTVGSILVALPVAAYLLRRFLDAVLWV